VILKASKQSQTKSQGPRTMRLMTATARRGHGEGSVYRDAARAARPAAADSARLRVLVCTKQTGAAANAAWQASSSKTVTTWKPCTSWDPVGSA